MAENQSAILSDVDSTAYTEHDAKYERLRQDFDYIVRHLHITQAIPSSFRSHLRQEEPGMALNKLMHDGVLIVSGGKGVGKSSLLHQMRAEVETTKKKAVFVDKQTTMPESAERDITRRIAAAYKDEVGNEPFINTIEEGITYLLNNNGILLVDEFTPLLIDDKEQAGQFKPLIDAVKIARAKGVPVAVVAHAFPDILKNAETELQISLKDNMIIPRNITPDEIAIMMSLGSAVKREEQVRMPAALRIEQSAVNRLYYYTGAKPAVAAQILHDIYYPYRKRDSTPIDIISERTIEDFFQQIMPGSFAEGSPTYERVTSIPRYLLKENPAELASFRDVFRLQEIDYNKSLAENAKVIVKPPQMSIDTDLATKWKRIGLIREEGENWVVDGTITAMALDHYLRRER